MLRAGQFRIRPFADTDLAVVAEAATDPYIPLITTVPASYTDQAARQFLARQRDRLRQDLGYSLAIAEADTDRAIGQIGLWLRNLDRGHVSIGYWVVPSARGRGAACHALAALARWAFEALPVLRVELYVEPRNLASVHTALGAGFHREGLLRSWQEVGGERRDMIMFSLLPVDLPPGT